MQCFPLQSECNAYYFFTHTWKDSWLTQYGLSQHTVEEVHQFNSHTGITVQYYLMLSSTLLWQCPHNAPSVWPLADLSYSHPPYLHILSHWLLNTAYSSVYRNTLLVPFVFLSSFFMETSWTESLNKSLCHLSFVTLYDKSLVAMNQLWLVPNVFV